MLAFRCHQMSMHRPGGKFFQSISADFDNTLLLRLIETIDYSN